MSLQEQTALACAYRCAKAAAEAASEILNLLPTVRWADSQAARERVAELRKAENTAWHRYLSASQQDVAEFQAAYEAQQRGIGRMQEGVTTALAA